MHGAPRGHEFSTESVLTETMIPGDGGSHRKGRVTDSEVQFGITPAESATHVFVEPVDCSFPGQIGRSLVIPFRGRVAIEAMYSARVNIAFMWNVHRVQSQLISWPGRCQSRVELPVMHQNRRLNFGMSSGSGGPP